MKYVRWMSILSLSGVLAGASFAQSKLESVEAVKSGSGVEFSVVGTQLDTPKVSRAFKGKVFMLDFMKTRRLGNKESETVNFAGVKSVRSAWYGRPPHVRVSFYLNDANLKPVLTKVSTGWTVTFGSVAKPTGDDYKSVYDGKGFDKIPPIKNPIIEAAKPVTFEKIETVSPTKPQTLNDTLAAQGFNVVNHTAPKTTPKPAPKERMVSLDFNNTELILILRALADQSGVNIVASPDISGRVSINLDTVSLTEALNLVTTIANVRYTKIGNTYLITSSARFSDAIRQVVGKLDEPGETKVITLKSGEGKQIKAATLKALPQLATEGYYDLFLPTEKITAKTSSGTGTTQSSGGPGNGSATPPTGGQGGSGAGGTATANEAQGSSVQTTSETEGSAGKDTYLVVVANPERMGEVTEFIEALDGKIAKANSLFGSAALATRAILLLSPNDDVIVEAVKSLADRDPRAASFKISLTTAGVPGQTNAQKMLVISGPAEGVDNLAALAESTDRSIAKALGIMSESSFSQAERLYHVLPIKWIEPAYALAELTRYIRGLSVSIMPSAVTPGAQGTVSSTFSDKGDQGSGTGGTSQGSTGATVNKETQDSESKTNITGFEPMKLLVYGTRAQIAEATSLLTALDVEPSQVAFELRVLELSKEDLLKVGLDWSIFTGAKLGTFRLNNALGSAGNTGGFALGQDRPSGAYTEGLLDQITTKNNLISRPNTIATDGRTSNIFVGDTVRYVESFQQTQNGLTVTVGKVNTGVEMFVTPRVGADGTMTIRMTPSLSILRGFTSVVGGGQLPQTSDRRADLTFNMNDGETIAIGGLITDQDKKSFGGVPVLRDLPLIGRLFGRTDNARIRTEVVFFVTAKIVDSKSRSTAADPRTGEGNRPNDPTKEKVKPKFSINP